MSPKLKIVGNTSVIDGDFEFKHRDTVRDEFAPIRTYSFTISLETIMDSNLILKPEEMIEMFAEKFKYDLIKLLKKDLNIK